MNKHNVNTDDNDESSDEEHQKNGTSKLFCADNKKQIISY